MLISLKPRNALEIRGAVDLTVVEWGLHLHY